MAIYNLGKVDSTIDGVRRNRSASLRLQHHWRSRPAARDLVRYSRGGRKRTQSDARHHRLSETHQASCGALIASPR